MPGLSLRRLEETRRLIMKKMRKIHGMQCQWYNQRPQCHQAQVYQLQSHQRWSGNQIPGVIMPEIPNIDIPIVNPQVSVTETLGMHISHSIKPKIWNSEYVQLEKMLDNDNTQPETFMGKKHSSPNKL